MPIRLAAPSNKIYENLLANYKNNKDKFDIELFKTTESQCADMMVSGKVEIALLTPLEYSRIHKDLDLKIIPGPALALNGFSQDVSIYFNPGLKNIDTCAIESKEDYLMKIAQVTLAERYGLSPDFIEMKEGIRASLDEYDAAIVYGKSTAQNAALDFSEDWHDSMNHSLPLAFWVCRAEEYPENVIEIVTSLKNPAVPNKEIIIDDTQEGEEFQRSGVRIYQWNYEIENALDETMQFLYYHQLVNNIVDSKVLGRD